MFCWLFICWFRVSYNYVFSYNLGKLFLVCYLINYWWFLFGWCCTVRLTRKVLRCYCRFGFYLSVKIGCWCLFCWGLLVGLVFCYLLWYFCCVRWETWFEISAEIVIMFEHLCVVVLLWYWFCWCLVYIVVGLMISAWRVVLYRLFDSLLFCFGICLIFEFNVLFWLLNFRIMWSVLVLFDLCLF